MTFNFVKNLKIFVVISLVIIVAGMGTALIAGFNLGIDFTGGTLLQIDLGKTVPVDEIRQITDEMDKNASIVHAGENQEQVIIKTAVSMSNEERMLMFDKFKEKYSLEDSALTQQNKFAPAIGKETQMKALAAVVIATVCMLVYISFRFQIIFGVSAIIALTHDVLIGLSVYAILRIPINTAFIAAMLTIVGYSINDTIVTFDRLRENIKLMRKETYENIVNASISQTLVRTINTSVTTLLAIVSLYVFGVEAIRELALPLIIGVVAGTYSSIFIAGPVWCLITSRKGKVNYYNPSVKR